MKPQQDLIARMQAGDVQAYNEVVQTYRVHALQWANRIVRDEYLAEDVVQIAMMKMKEKAGDLKDPSKFIGWLRQLVRRSALNYIRGLANQVQLTNRIELLDEAARPGLSGDNPLDRILMNDLTNEVIRMAVNPLSAQSRALLTSHAIDDATPEELANRLKMRKSNVYNLLSRSRARANDERFRIEVDRHLTERRRLGLPVARQLPVPRYERPYAHLSILIAEVLRTAGETNWSLTELMGLSGDAFRLTVADGCSWQGISTYDWSYSAHRTLERIGYSGTCFGRPSQLTYTPEQQVLALSTMQASIDRGLPVILWNLAINEFGFAHGYNDDDRTVSYASYDHKSRTFSYDRLGRMDQEPALFVLALKQRVASPVTDNDAIASIIQYARGQEPPIDGFHFGSHGYRHWLTAVRNEQLDLQGHAYLVAILSEARHQAALYLSSLAERAKGAERRNTLNLAAECYRRVSENFSGLYPSFPFGYGGSAANRYAFIHERLSAALEAEEEATSHLAKIIR